MMTHAIASIAIDAHPYKGGMERCAGCSWGVGGGLAHATPLLYVKRTVPRVSYAECLPRITCSNWLAGRMLSSDGSVYAYIFKS